MGFDRRLDTPEHSLCARRRFRGSGLSIERRARFLPERSRSHGRIVGSTVDSLLALNSAIPARRS